MRYKHLIFGAALTALAPQPSVAAPPEFAPVGPVTWVNQNNPASFNLDVHDPDGDPVVVTVTGLPPGLQLDLTSQYWAVTDFAKNALRPQDLEFDANGDLIFSTWRAAFTGGGLRKLDGSWWVPRGSNVDGPMTGASTFSAGGLERASDGTVYFADHNGGLRMVSNQTVSTLATPSGLFPGTYYANDVTLSGADIVVAYSAGVVSYDGAGSATVLADDSAIAGGLGYLLGIESDGAGGFYLSSSNRRQIFHLNSAGQVSVFAGHSGGGSSTGTIDGPNASATFQYQINQMTLAPDGALYVANSKSVRIIQNGEVRTVAGRNGTPISFSAADGIVRQQSGTFLVSDRHTSRIRQLHPQGWQITGSYSGPNCGGMFNATITATDSNGNSTSTQRKFSVAPMGPGCGGPPPGPSGAGTGSATAPGSGTSPGSGTGNGPPIITPGGTLTRPGSQSNSNAGEDDEVTREGTPRAPARKRDEKR